MHLLREGQFSVASTFIQEAEARPPHPEPTPGTPNPYVQGKAWEKDLVNGTFNSEKLQQQFAEMYHILRELRQQRNLAPAIAWARERSAILETRGSNLEFELCRLQFVCLFVGHDGEGNMGDSANGPLRAWAYARSEFGPFQHRYAREVQQLVGAMAFWQNISDSPYRRFFYNDSAWEEVANSFTREFCSLLGLSADSPLYIAATAGAIALPTLLKLQNIMKEKRTEWTTQNELPVSPFPNVFSKCSTNYGTLGRNTVAAFVSFPFHLRMPCIQGARHGSEPPDDDAVRPCYCSGVSRQVEQRFKIQMPVLPRRKSSS